MDLFLVEIFKGVGILFLVLGFGYSVAVRISSGSRKKDSGDGVSAAAGNGSKTLDETNMRRALENYIPDGETLLAGIHAVAVETAVNYVFGECLCLEDRLIPHPGGGAYVLNKKKYEDHSVYIGITSHFLVMTDCGKESYYYQWHKIEKESDLCEPNVHKVTEEILLADIGKLSQTYVSETWRAGRRNAASCGVSRYHYGEEMNAPNIWLAEYRQTPLYEGRYDMWQYTSSGAVAGIEGRVDLNISYLGVN